MVDDRDVVRRRAGGPGPSCACRAARCRCISGDRRRRAAGSAAPAAGAVGARVAWAWLAGPARLRRAPQVRILRGLEQPFGMSPGRLVARVGAEHAAELLDQLACGRAARRPCGRRSARARRAAARLATRKWRAASEATCGRWVMQRTWRAAASVAQPLADGPRRGAADAGVDLVEHDRRRRRPAPVATLISASITRDSSPPEAISRSGPAAHARVGRDQELDGVGAPAAPKPVERALAGARARATIATSNDASAIASSASSPRTARSERAPRLARARRAARPRAARARRASRVAARASSRAVVSLGVRRAGRARRGSARRARAPPRSCRRAFASAARAARAAPRPAASRAGSASSRSR